MAKVFEHERIKAIQEQGQIVKEIEKRCRAIENELAREKKKLREEAKTLVRLTESLPLLDQCAIE